MYTRKLRLGLVLLALALGSWWLAHRAGEPPAPAEAQATRAPDYVIERFVANAMNPQGTPRYRLSARRLTHYPDGDTAHLVAPVLVQYLPDGGRTTTRAKTGIMPGDASEILMRGDVHVTRTADGGSAAGEIRAERLRVELDR